MNYYAGQFINLFVESTSPHEIILNVDQDLQGDHQFVMPVTEQAHRLSINSEILCILYQDLRSNELFASMKLEKHANKNLEDLKLNQKVQLHIIRETDLGFKCLIDEKYIGMLYKNEIFQPLDADDKIEGYIKKLREDQKIDLILRAPGHKATMDIADKIVEELKNNNGHLQITDKTPPEDIYDLFGVSKKKFKIALGGLYKKRIIQVLDDGIKLVEKLESK